MVAQTSTDCNDEIGPCSTLYSDLQLLVDHSAHTDLTGKLDYLAATNQSINILTAFKSNGTVSSAISELQRSVCRPKPSGDSTQLHVVLPAYKAGGVLQPP